MEYHNRAKTHKVPFIAFLAGVFITLAAGGYYLFGPQGERHRREVDRWLKRARYEIIQRMERIENITEEQYRKIVDEVAEKYATMKGYGQEKAALLRDTFRRKWTEMKEAARQAREEAEAEVLAEESMRLRERNEEGKSLS